MIIKISIALFFCLALFADGCDSQSVSGGNSAPANAQQTAAASPANSSSVKSEGRPGPVANNSAEGGSGTNAASDVCALIEKAEIASVQGQPVQSVAPSSQTRGSLLISQCYYTVLSADGTKNLSVHLQVIRSTAKSSGRDEVREFWREKLKGEKGQEEEEEKEAGERQAIQGLGDEAFWLGNRITGAIYALKDDKIVRVSVGGPGDDKTKIEKSRMLAQKALERLK